jgi:hypothetical protein
LKHAAKKRFPNWLILFALMMEVIRSSETSVLTRATQRHIQEDGIFHFHDHKNSTLNPFLSQKNAFRALEFLSGPF